MEEETKEPLIGCNDGCKRQATLKEAEQQAWQYLEITKRWRCPTCRRELAVANERKELT